MTASSTNERRNEAALRRLPDAHSLALRLRDAGVADEVICGYLQIEPEGWTASLSWHARNCIPNSAKLPRVNCGRAQLASVDE
ncbi:hypothetical protein [Mycobacterium sp.]|uniref:hypothetical protein n=1 Tax=Mycobacterium sp. TaxID=1785 RepID=UPI0031DE6324